MKTVQIVALVLLCCLASSAVAQMRFVGYFINWAQYRPEPRKFFPENINPKYYTHLNYAFAKIDVATMNILPAEWNDVLADGTGLYARFQKLKTINPKLKTLISVGGASAGTDVFSVVASTAANRALFASNAVKFCRTYGFDGVDVDWEFPGAADKDNFSALLAAMRAAFNAETSDTSKRLLLTIATAAGDSFITPGYDIPAIAPSLDFVNVMTYDYHGSWESVTGHNSPLFDPTSNLHCDWTINRWNQGGIPRSKLVFGLALYGRTWTLSNPAVNGIGAPTKSAGPAQPYTGAPGFIALFETIALRDSPNSIVRLDETQGVRYLINGDLWVTYESQKTMAMKLAYLKQKGLGGGMVWSIDMDVDPGNAKYAALIPFISQTLGVSS